jgi:ComF family protein
LHQCDTLKAIVERALVQEELGALPRGAISTFPARVHVEQFGHPALVRGRGARDKAAMMGGVLRTAGRWVLDFALPPRCAGCDAIVSDVHSFCAGCWTSIDFLGHSGCSTCGLPLEATEQTTCGACLAAPPRIARTRAAVAYDDLTRTLAIRLKYGRKIAIARTMARYMAPLVDGGAERLLIPVPLHRWRLWGRGFNQSALIARELSRRLSVPTDALVLRRIRRTPPLKGMSPLQRRRTVAGAFHVRDKAAVAGKTVILVDDVLTTGSTAEACARTLKRAGAARVELVSWARVVKPSQLMR